VEKTPEFYRKNSGKRVEVFLKNLWYNDNIGILRKSWEESWLFLLPWVRAGPLGKEIA